MNVIRQQWLQESERRRLTRGVATNTAATGPEMFTATQAGDIQIGLSGNRRLTDASGVVAQVLHQHIHRQRGTHYAS